jgi:hypothetical protein
LGSSLPKSIILIEKSNFHPKSAPATTTTTTTTTTTITTTTTQTTTTTAQQQTVAPVASEETVALETISCSSIWDEKFNPLQESVNRQRENEEVIDFDVNYNEYFSYEQSDYFWQVVNHDASYSDYEDTVGFGRLLGGSKEWFIISKS